MRTLSTILLILILSTPGIALADPGVNSSISFWQDLWGSVLESLSTAFNPSESTADADELSTIGGAIDPPYGAASETMSPDLGDGIDINGSDDGENEPPLPNHGGTIDPYG